MEFLIGAAVGALSIIVGLITWFVAAKRRVRGEAVAAGEAQLELAEKSIDLWEQRLGWSPSATRFLATAFAFQGMENMASVLELAKEIHGSETFEEDFTGRAVDDPSIIGPTLQASRFITSDELRELLGRILASDVREPGSVSRRAVSIAENLSRGDLTEFLKLRSVTWRSLDSDIDYLLIVGKLTALLGAEFLSIDHTDIGVSYSSIQDLKQHGLVEEQAGGFTLNIPRDDSDVLLGYRDRFVSLQPTEKARDTESGLASLMTGMFTLTKQGAEILSLFLGECYPSPEGYYEEVCQRWNKDGWTVLGIEPRP